MSSRVSSLRSTVGGSGLKDMQDRRTTENQYLLLAGEEPLGNAFVIGGHGNSSRDRRVLRLRARASRRLQFPATSGSSIRIALRTCHNDA